MINIEEFKKVEIKIGKILSAERIDGSEKLLKFRIDLGSEERQIIGGLALAYPDPSVLVGREIPIIANLEPRKLMGLESQGMILACTDENDLPVILTPLKEVPLGSILR